MVFTQYDILCWFRIEGAIEVKSSSTEAPLSVELGSGTLTLSVDIVTVDYM